MSVPGRIVGSGTETSGGVFNDSDYGAPDDGDMVPGLNDSSPDVVATGDGLDGSNEGRMEVSLDEPNETGSQPSHEVSSNMLQSTVPPESPEDSAHSPFIINPAEFKPVTVAEDSATEATGDAQVPAENVELRNAMNEVVPMFEIDQEQAETAAVSDYVQRRMGELSESDPGEAIGLVSGGTDKFIAPDTPMIMSALMSKPYYLNDPGAYEKAFPYIKRSYEGMVTSLSPERAYLNAVLNGVNFGQIQYFGSIAGDIDHRMAVAADFITDDDAEEVPVSIADFNTSAMCQERAGIAHNGLLIYGVESKFEVGSLGVKKDDGTVESEPHAFLTITGTSGNRSIYDPTNPILIKDETGEVVSVRPAFWKLSPDEKGQQEVQLREYTVTGGKPQESRNRTLIYTFAAES